MRKYLVLLFMSVAKISYAGYYYDGGAMGFVIMSTGQILLLLPLLDFGNTLLLIQIIQH